MEDITHGIMEDIMIRGDMDSMVTDMVTAMVMVMVMATMVGDILITDLIGDIQTGLHLTEVIRVTIMKGADVTCIHRVDVDRYEILPHIQLLVEAGITTVQIHQPEEVDIHV